MQLACQQDNSCLLIWVILHSWGCWPQDQTWKLQQKIVVFVVFDLGMEGPAILPVYPIHLVLVEQKTQQVYSPPKSAADYQLCSLKLDGKDNLHILCVYVHKRKSQDFDLL